MGKWNMAPDPQTLSHARALYSQGAAMPEIARETGVPIRTLYRWRANQAWNVSLDAEAALQARLVRLTHQADKGPGEYQEIDRLTEALGKLLRSKGIAVQRGQQREAKQTGRGRRKGAPAQNEIGEIDFPAIQPPPLFAYQRSIAEDASRFLFWLKARQIGATTHAIAWKALRRAIETGYAQIFISASKRQVQTFNEAIRRLAAAHLGLELKGSKEMIPLLREGQPWGAFQFLSTNTATAQGYSGDVYIDEACWIPRFDELERAASAMATLKRHRKVYLSTPSVITHPAWRLWKGRLGKDGQPIADGITRVKTTIHDAIAGGNHLLDLATLRTEYPAEAFRQLFLCEPIDDEQSVFRLAQLERCMSEPASWKPIGNAPLWLGYDPSRHRDYACLALIARVKPPAAVHAGEQVKTRLRLVTCHKWRGQSFRWQAERIREISTQHNVERIAIDVTGMGQAVYELVREFFKRVTPITYTLETKNELVQKVRQVVDDGRLEYALGDAFVTSSFLALKQSGTDAGRVTYKAGRTAEAGHAEAFWAIAHALHFEPLRRRRRVLIS